MYNFNRVGIDKIKLVSFDIKLTNLNDLYKHNNITISDSNLYKREFIVNDEIVEIGTILISDRLFKLNIGVRREKSGNMIPYQTIEINPAKVLYGENINNISDAKELLEVISIIEQRLMKYGMEVNLKKSIIEEIEVNNNIKLNEQFSRYKNVFELIKSVLPKTLIKGATYDDRGLADYTGFKVSNTQISLKFYDKFTERNMESKFSLLRIEYRFLNRYKVKDVLGFNNVEDLLNNFNKVENSFNVLIEKHIISKVQKKINELSKVMNEKLIEIQSTQRYYIKYLLAITQDENIFDYEIMVLAINKLETSKGSKSLRKKEVRKLLGEREEKGKSLFFKNIDRLNEIVTKLGFNIVKIKFNMK